MTETATEVRERPILFSGEMVRAILDGRKTVTRRVVKGCQDLKLVERGNPRDPGNWYVESTDGCIYTLAPNSLADGHFRCPYGVSGDRLWVRETWADTNGESGPMISYRAGGDRFLINDSYPVDYSRYPGCQFTMWCGDLRRGEPGHPWRSPIHMPKWASRITLEITDVRVERLQEITDEDCLAEGSPLTSEAIGYPMTIPRDTMPRAVFAHLWDSLNAKRGHSWKSDPWVWVISFQRIEP